MEYGLKLFDCFSRTEERYKRHNDSLFEYYNASARTKISQVRAFLEQWYSVIPNEETKKDLLGRIRSNDDIQYKSAVFQITMYALLKNIGYDVTVDPRIDDGQPDFIVTTKQNHSFILEATIVEESDSKRREEDLKAELVEALQDIELPMTIGLSFKTTSDMRTNLKELQIKIKRWAFDLIATCQATTITEEASKYIWEMDGKAQSGPRVTSTVCSL